MVEVPRAGRQSELPDRRASSGAPEGQPPAPPVLANCERKERALAGATEADSALLNREVWLAEQADPPGNAAKEYREAPVSADLPAMACLRTLVSADLPEMEETAAPGRRQWKGVTV